MNDIHFKLRFDFLQNHLYDHQILLDWLSHRYGPVVQYTFGEETSYKKKKLHWHCHITVNHTSETKLTKTPFNQLFKTWYKKQHPNGLPLPPNGYSIIIEKEIKDIDLFFAYPLKCQHDELVSHGFTSEKLKFLNTTGITLYKNKIKYIKEKELKEETTNNTWKAIVAYLDLNYNTSINPSPYIQIPEDNPNQPPSVIPGHIHSYLADIGELLIQYYMDNEDCQIPFNLDSKSIRYSLLKKYLLPRDCHYLISRFK